MRFFTHPLTLTLTLILMLFALTGASCNTTEISADAGPKSATGIKEVKAKIHTGSDGLTTEQRNVKDRLEEDSKPGVIKHLYIISAYSGDVLLYSTVRGKVTSSGKRLTPYMVFAGATGNECRTTYGVDVNVGGQWYKTPEILQDDGTFGHSIEYLYWYDSKGIFHTHYPSGGQIIHISSEPLVVKKVIINVEERHEK